ncbi:hypothetical protein JCM10212_001962 [Sporobolomyces blumeae]
MSERRRAEIAEKRARLAQLKQARQEREASSRSQLSHLSDSLSSTGPTSPDRPTAASVTPPPPQSRTHARASGTPFNQDEIESLLRGVGVGSHAATPLSNEPSSLRSSASAPPPALLDGEPASGDATVARPRDDEHPTPPASTPGPSDPDASQEPPSTFASSSIEVYSIPPKPKIVYDKSIQTSSDLFPYPAVGPSSARTRQAGVGQDDENEVDGDAGGVGRETAEELRSRIVAELEAERVQLDLEIAEEKRLADLALDETLKRGLAPAQLDQVLTSPGFSEFLSSSTKILQRALSDSYDYLRDYTIMDDQAGEDGEGRKQRVRLLGSWRDEDWGKGRSVTGLDWSPKFPELFVASYNKNPMALNEPDGIVAVWNLHLLERPEFVFHAQSDILSVSFSPFHPNLVIGGTYSGQILLWDTRSRHPNPVLKTPLSASGHTHPVYSLSMVGTQNAHSLVSASTDGTVCGWSLDMLARPQETLRLVHPGHTKTDEVSITSLGFPLGETTTFWVGTEEGNVYGANRYDRAGSKAGLVPGEVYRGHSGPVTSLDFHPVEGTVDLSDLFLTSGVDWTVKLWKAGGTGSSSSVDPSSSTGGHKPSSSSLSGATSNGTSGALGGLGTGSIAPLFSFEEADDYVYDVKWHPHHPALFGSVDGAGKFELWNLNLDTEVPILSTPVEDNRSNSTSNGTARRAGLNKLAWDKKEGKRCAVGSSDGKVYVYEVASDVITPREGEWEQMRRTCNTALATNVT